MLQSYFDSPETEVIIADYYSNSSNSPTPSFQLTVCTRGEYTVVFDGTLVNPAISQKYSPVFHHLLTVSREHHRALIDSQAHAQSEETGNEEPSVIIHAPDQNVSEMLKNMSAATALDEGAIGRNGKGNEGSNHDDITTETGRGKASFEMARDQSKVTGKGELATGSGGNEEDESYSSIKSQGNDDSLCDILEDLRETIAEDRAATGTQMEGLRVIGFVSGETRPGFNDKDWTSNESGSTSELQKKGMRLLEKLENLHKPTAKDKPATECKDDEENGPDGTVGEEKEEEHYLESFNVQTNIAASNELTASSEQKKDKEADGKTEAGRDGKPEPEVHAAAAGKDQDTTQKANRLDAHISAPSEPMRVKPSEVGSWMLWIWNFPDFVLDESSGPLGTGTRLWRDWDGLEATDIVAAQHFFAGIFLSLVAVVMFLICFIALNQWL